MNISKSSKKVVLAFVLTLCTVSAYFHFRIMSVQGLLKTSMSELNIQDAIPTGLEIRDKVGYTSVTQDPNIIFNNLDKGISNVVIYISDMSVVNMGAQLYLDNGTGFSEGNSHSFTLRKGMNRVKLKGISQVKSMRFDPTSVENQTFKLTKIVINEANTELLFIAFPMTFIAMLLAVYLGKNYKMNVIVVTILSYNFIKLIDGIPMDSPKKVIVCVLLLVMSILTCVLFSQIYEKYMGGKNEKLYKKP